MRAARFHGKSDIRVEDVDVPSVRDSDDVLVEVLFCGICGTDLHEYLVGPIVTPTSPHPLTGATLPQTLGHEFSARVVETGSDVTDVAVGERVAIMPAIVCGRCHYCRRGLGHLCVKFACTGLSAETGGLAQYAVLKDYQVSTLPDEVSDVAGAVVEPACVAAYGIDRAGVRGGDVVLVTGAGPIGILSAMYASAVGAATVVIAEPNPNRAALARAMDIGPVLDPTSGELEAIPRRPHPWARGRCDGGVLRVDARPHHGAEQHATSRLGGPDRPAHQAGNYRRDGVVREGHQPDR